MLLSVVIPAYNHLDKVLRCLNTLRSTAHGNTDAMYHNWPLFHVYDDCSPDYDMSLLIPNCAALTFRNASNLGFNGNVNRAVEQSRTDLIAIVNQDVYALPDLSLSWDKYIRDAFNKPQVGIVGPKLLFPNGTIQSAGGLFDAKGQPYHRCLGYSDITYHEVNTPEIVDWVTGAFFVVRRSVWEALGGFDPLFAPAYWEDVDFCLRAREAGWKTWYEPRACFVHEVGSSGSPGLAAGAPKFYQRWIASGKIKPSGFAVMERFW